MKKNLYQSLRDGGLVSIDETLPEIRSVWNLVRDAVWACMRFTLVGAVLIVGAGAWLGVGALLSNAHAATYTYTDLSAEVGRDRRCGLATAQLDYVTDPATGAGTTVWLQKWHVYRCGDHNPVISCPPGLVRLDSGGGWRGDQTYSDWSCIDMSVAPQPDFLPRLRPCYGADGLPCNGVADFWQGEWYGTWRPGYTPPQCPLPLVPRAERSGEAYGRVRYYCGSPL